MDVYTKDSLPEPVEQMSRFRKITTTPMTRVSWPCVVETQEGPVTLPEGWRGWIAVDGAGYPYPITEEEHRRTYEAVVGQTALG